MVMVYVCARRMGYGVILASTFPYTLSREGKRHYFTNVAINKIDSLQPQVHGLLGQNAIDPPPRTAPRGCEAQSNKNARFVVGASAVGVRFDDACEEPEGHQGEGFIDGTYLDYMVEALDKHGEHKYSRLRAC